jgi:UDP-N-acetylglucosamine--N-acetylmuramyl-(pentapeptide) pyrophosphoryl-undecaprenol N-acetylglucosamine transferase
VNFAFAAAGTGGHVYPALAVAGALVEKGVARSDIVFFGGNRMEATTVPAAGFPFVPVEIRGLRRSLDFDNLKLPSVVWRARAEIRRIMEERSVRALAAFGGYVTVPAALAASSLRVPVVLQEQNAVPGLANRLMARMASSVFVAFPAATRTLRRAKVVGNPLRPVFDGFDRERLRPEALSRYDLRDAAPVVGVLGGSLGAKILNDAVAPLTSLLDAGSAVLHLTGRSHGEEMQRLAGQSPVTWRTVAFEDSMEYFYAAADLVLSRAGALTISELALTATPAVVVPYAAGTAGHQAANASEMAAAGALHVVGEPAIRSVPQLVAELSRDRVRLDAMSQAAASQARRGAADVIAEAMLGAARG